jgi:hypothetical protein
MPSGELNVDTFVRPLKNGLLGVVAHVADPTAGTPPPATVVMTAPAHVLGDGDGHNARDDDALTECDADGDDEGKTEGDGVADKHGVAFTFGAQMARTRPLPPPSSTTKMRPALVTATPQGE